MFENKWEKRWHPLREEWIVYAAHRNDRPWTTSENKIAERNTQPFDSNCYLCPGNSRIHGDKNPQYEDVFIFDNDHPVVGVNAPEINQTQGLNEIGFYRKESAKGIARVVCYNKNHSITLGELPLESTYKVFLALREQMKEFKDNSLINNVLIFENKGELCGVSNPHPHGQIYATDFNFSLTQQHLNVAKKFRDEHNKNIFEEIIKAEISDGIRIFEENKGAFAVIPFFARYAYETMIFPKNRHATLVSMNDDELLDFAEVFHRVIRKFDQNFGMIFPYVMTFQQAPVDGYDYPEHHLFISILPPLRQPNLIKHLAGPEIGAGTFMSDTMPEDKAQELRNIAII
ncbi:MAG: galactose-phosphate uridylyltransferase [Bacteroidota bacterium]|jgi:UDPglucose--hexose-1-phosphate uridylyltransferase